MVQMNVHKIKQRQCKVEGCNRPPDYARGLCKPCYMRFYRAGDLEILHPWREGCMEPGCNNRHFSQGLCRLHYSHLKKYGHTEARKWPTAEQRFLAKVKVNPITHCWEWQGSKTENQYGLMGYEGRLRRANRIAMALYRGFDITSPIQVLHHCDNPCCVNVEHLFLGDNQANVDDKMRKGRHRILNRKQRLKRQLTEKQVAEIRRRKMAGEKAKTIAKDLNISERTVGEIHRREHCRHLPDPPAAAA